MAVDWRQVRSQFPVLANWTYLNTATFGPTPRCALDAMEAHFRRRDQQACLDFLDWYAGADRVRQAVARLIGAEAADIAFIPNAGTALGWLINGMEWRAGDHILTLSDEFPNNLYFPKVLEALGVQVTEVPSAAGRFTLKEFTASLTERTRLVLFSTVNYSTGLRPPLQEIGAELRKRGILLFMDGTQSVGALRFDVRDLHCDVLAVHGYKWLLCPAGIGFAYLRPEVREWLEPTVYSWRSHRRWRNVDELHHGRPELPEEAMKYEGGMQNFSGIFAMGAVLKLFESLGLERIEGRVMEIVERTRDVLRDCGGSLLADRHSYYDSPVIAAQFPEADVSKLAAELRSRKIAVAARKGSLRVSPHFFNDDTDLSNLRDGLRDLLPRRR